MNYLMVMNLIINIFFLFNVIDMNIVIVSYVVSFDYYLYKVMLIGFF